MGGGVGLKNFRGSTNSGYFPFIGLSYVISNCQSRVNRFLPREFVNVTAEGPKISVELALFMSRIIYRQIGETTPRSNGASA